jgi:4-amino-4-deoxy-L-arabinose transferase-like glycosyltransferase
MTLPEIWKNDKGRLTPLLVSLLIFLLYLLIAADSTLWDRDEPRYASVTTEMIRSGNYLVPTLDGRPWPEKPPLMYWLMSIPIRIFGPTALACRLFCILGTVATCIVTYFIGKKLFSKKTALFSTVVLSSSMLLLFVGTMAIADGIVLPLITAVMLIFVTALKSRFGFIHFLLTGIFLGLAMLAKGPIGLLPLFVIFPVIIFSRNHVKEKLRTCLYICLAAILGVAIFMLWAVPASMSAGGDFFKTFITRNITGRATSPMEHHGGNWFLYLPYYIPIIIAGFFPFILHLPGSLSALLGGRIANRQTKILLIAWPLSIFLIMSIAATKLPHYILFIWPALALIVSNAVDPLKKDLLTERDRKWLRGGIWFFGPVAFLLTAAFIGGPFLLKTKSGLSITSLNWSLPLCGLVIIVMAVVAIRYQLKEQFIKSSAAVLVGIAALLMPILIGVLPGIEQIKLPPRLAKIVTAKTDPNTPVYTYKFDEPSLDFYIGRPIQHLAGEKEVSDLLLQKKDCVLIIPKNLFDELSVKSGKLPAEIIASVKGINYSKGKLLDMLVITKEQNLE